MIKAIKNIIKRSIFGVEKRFLSSREQVLGWDPWSLEPNTLQLLKYISKYYAIKVYYAVSPEYISYAKNLLPKEIIIFNRKSFRFKLLFYSSKYFITSQWGFPKDFTSQQIIVNLSHGVPYKRIGKFRGANGIQAHITASTSVLTKKIMTKAFDVSPDSTIISGFPRNDLLIETKEKKSFLKEKILEGMTHYKKVIIWMPTWRKDVVAHVGSTNGQVADNIFQIENFDTEMFNKILQQHNTLCIVKPHPVAAKDFKQINFSHIHIIQDQFLWEKGYTLYHLAGISDILISDMSSIIIDYMLIDKPIICFSTDWEKYKKNRGFIFEDMETWLPSKLFQTNSDFFEHLEYLLQYDKDPFQKKREQLKDKFFKYQDTNSSKRLANYIFNKYQKK